MCQVACAGPGPGADSGAAAGEFSAHLGEPVQIVPGEGLPAEAETQDSNNNLDVVVHEGETFLAFRTAPTHFASSETRLHVVRSADRQTWTHELTLHYETDLREPRFLAWEGELLLYFARLGSDPGAFEPGDSMLTVRGEEGSWSEPEVVFAGEDFIPWRIKVRDGAAWMTGYYGGGDVYDLDELPEIEVVWLRSTDGRSWEPAVGDGVLRTGGSSETDLEVRDDGSAVFVARNEAGDPEGWGSWICRSVGPVVDDAGWDCALDPKKYDSPLLFRQATPEEPDAVWLIGRRHLSETGNYDLLADGAEPAETHGQQTTKNQVAYWNERKRCALWRVDAEALSVTHVLDLPSSGDTCFPSILSEGDDAWSVWNYSSPLGEDPTWLQGQYGLTHIHRLDLTFGAAPAG